MNLFNIIRIILYLGLIPLILGMLYTRFSEEDRYSLILNYASGLIIMLAVMQLVAEPMIRSNATLTKVTNRYMLAILVLCMISLVLNLPLLAKRVTSLVHRSLPSWPAWIAAALIVAQAITLSVNEHIDEDDSFYITMATEAYQTDEMYIQDTYTGQNYADMEDNYDQILNHYILSPFPIFNAVISRLINLHPAITGHTIFPLIFIPFAYMIYALLGRQMFGEDRFAAACFLLLAAVCFIFSGYSLYTQGTFLLTRVWQGKAILGSALLPSVFYYCTRAFSKKYPVAEVLMLAVLMLACCHISSMGIMLGAIMMGLVTVADIFRFKKPGILIYGIVACIPNIVYILMYMNITA